MTVRDPEQWFESISSTVKQGMSLKLPIPHLRRVQRFISTYPVNTLFDGRIDDKAHMMHCFERHLEDVKNFVPDHQLLVYNVRQGWEPLCAFLEVDVPQRPFPRANVRGSFKETIMKVVVGRLKS